METRSQREDQLALSFASPSILPDGGGGWIVKAGKPIAEFTPFQFGKAMGISRSTVYRLLDAGIIAEVRRPSPRKILIGAGAAEKFRQDTRDPEFWVRNALLRRN